jgi:undecaprenyl pyrophosphate phosphatase UppP
MTTDLNRTAIERSLRRRLHAAILGGPLLLAPLMLAFVEKAISFGTFELSLFACIALETAAILTILVNAKRRLRLFVPDFVKPPDTAERERLRRSIRSLQRIVVFLALALVCGIWVQRDELSFATLGGVAISLLVQAWLILTIHRLKRRLNFTAVAGVDQTPDS